VFAHKKFLETEKQDLDYQQVKRRKLYVKERKEISTSRHKKQSISKHRCWNHDKIS